MSGRLTLVGTPIGNLSDLSPRAVEALRACDFIAAEDTRVTLKLLNHFGIQKPLVSYFEHNKRERGEVICARLLQGENAVLVTDAGMPAISDPGQELVDLCHERQIPVGVVPGPTAVTTALALAGLPTGRFCFEGFLSVDKRRRRQHLESLERDPRTLVFYEAPHKLASTLQDLLAALGDRPLALVRELHPELIVVAAYGRILPEDILNTPPYGSINVHSSLLPKYRGAAPINWAILNGERETGVTIMYMAKELDAGDILHVLKTDIDPQEDAQALTARLAELGAQALSETVEQLRAGTAHRTVQDHSAYTYAPMLTKDMGVIDWTKPAGHIHNQVRGLIPWPCASTELGGATVKVFRTEVLGETGKAPGTVAAAGKAGIDVACGDGHLLRILELQPQGGRRMAAADYLRGHPLQVEA